MQYPRLTLGVLVTALLLGGCSSARVPAASAEAPSSAVQDEAAILSLAGQWRFRLDPDDAGVGEAWFKETLPDRLRLPGALQAQGFGNKVTAETRWLARGWGINQGLWYTHPLYEPYRRPGNVRFFHFLQPDRHYVGPAWYQRTVEVPEAWQGRRIVLFLERCHWTTTVWVDGAKAGSGDSLAAPHVYDLTKHLAPGEHRLTIRVDNRMHVDVGPSAHSVSDQTQTAWNGIVGRLELRATNPVWIDDVQVYPDVAKKRARVRVTVGNATGKAVAGELRVGAEAFNTDRAHAPPPKRVAVEAAGDRTVCTVDYSLGEDVHLWDEFHPALYRMRVALEAEAAGQAVHDAAEVTFGMRRFGTSGTRFEINGRPVYLRGNLECCIFPLTGWPPTDVEAWRRIMRIAKSYGLNHLRFHSWCPPEACFQAADEVGIYLQPEVCEWTHVHTDEQHAFFRRESERILRAYGNHPSFVMMALGNEGYCTPEIMRDLLGRWKQDPRRVYTGKCNSNRSVVDAYEYYVGKQWKKHTMRHVASSPPAPMHDYRKAVAASSMPLVVHETVQRCSFPDPAWAEKYTGWLRPAYLDIARDQLRQRGMLDQVPAFVRASGRWQVEQFKEEVEADLRTPGFGGFQLLQLHDFPGQGSALVGVLDAFWDSKGYVTPERFREFCGPTVPLVRMERLTWTTADRLQATVEAAHFGPEPLGRVAPRCRIVDTEGREVFSQSLPPREIPIGNGTPLGQIGCSLAEWKAPARYDLIVELPGTGARNRWPFWVYPASLEAAEPGEVRIVHDLDEAAVGHLEGGGRVLLLPPRSALRGGSFPDPFRSIYWTSASLDRAFGPNGGHTLSVLCDPAHPVFRHFPTGAHTNWQWWELLSRSRPMVLDDWETDRPWPKAYRPLVQVIDCWKYNRKLAVLAEAKVGPGRLMICTMDIESDLDGRVVARQFRHSLLAYMTSDGFDPAHAVTLDQVRALLKEPTGLQRLGATATASSQQRGYEASRAIDGNPKTFWHTRWEPDVDGHPHHLVIDLKKTVTVRGLVYLPRQDMTNGRIAKFAVYVSGDGKQWGRPAAAGTWPNAGAEQRVRFEKPRQARFVKLVAESEGRGREWASAAEVDVILE